MQEKRTERCPQCETEDGLISYGVHPVYSENGQLDIQVEAMVCRACGHVQLRQVVAAL